MKNVLLGTTALLATGLMAGESAAQMAVTISGYYRFDAGYASESGVGSFTGPNGTTVVTTRGYDFASRARLTVDASGTADNGLMYGARIRFNQSYGSSLFDQLDETYGYVAGAFGQVIFGDAVSAGTLLRIYAPDAAGTGIANGVWTAFAKGNTDLVQRRPDSGPGLPGNVSLANLGIFDDVLNGSDRTNSFSTKLVYTTTGINLGGFTFGLSFAPQMGERGRAYSRNATVAQAAFGGTPGAPVGVFENVLSLAAEYDAPDLFNGIGLRASAQYNTGNARVANIEDLSSWMIGAQVVYRGFTVGGHYIDNGKSGSVTGTGLGSSSVGLLGTGVRHDSFTGWGFGMEYTTGPWTVGVNYFATSAGGIQSSPNPNAFTSPVTGYRLDSYGVGVTYVAAPGLTFGADLVHYEEDIPLRSGAAPVKQNSGTIIAARTQVTF